MAAANCVTEYNEDEWWFDDAVSTHVKTSGAAREVKGCGMTEDSTPIM